MKKHMKFLLIPAFMAIVVLHAGFGFSEHTGPGIYNDEDLEKYESPADAGAGAATPETADAQSGEGKKEKDRGYWCRMGTLYLETIEEAKKEIDEILARFPEKKMLNLDDVSLPDGVQQMKLNQIRTKLRGAEMELRMLEDDAQRGDVPPGWIRCQFE